LRRKSAKAAIEEVFEAKDQKLGRDVAIRFWIKWESKAPGEIGLHFSSIVPYADV
jgi:hypothetical protein